MSLQYDSFRINSSSEIPASLVPESSNHLIANVSKENAYVTATNSQTAGPNSFLLFSIPNRGFLEPNSLSLGFTVAIQSQVAGDTVGFCYPDRTANALIQRITVSCGGIILEMVENSNILASILRSHCTTKNHLDNLVVTEQALVTLATGGNKLRTYDSMLSLPSVGLLNAQKALPLGLMGANLDIQIDFASVNRSCFDSNGANIVENYTITVPKLYYTRIDPPLAYMNLLRENMIKNGKVFTVYYNRVYGFETQHNLNSDLFYPGSLSVSSCQAILTTEIETAALNTSNATTKPFLLNAVTDHKFYIDNIPVTSYPISNEAQCFFSLQKAIGNWGADKHGSSFIANYQDFEQDVFCMGWDLMKTRDNAFTHSGTPISTFRLEKTSTANLAATSFLYFICSTELEVDANGICSVKR